MLSSVFLIEFFKFKYLWGKNFYFFFYFFFTCLDNLENKEKLEEDIDKEHYRNLMDTELQRYFKESSDKTGKTPNLIIL